MCITTYQPDTISNPNPTTKQHVIVNIQLNIVTCPTYPDKFIRDNVVGPSVPTWVVIITLPSASNFPSFVVSLMADIIGGTSRGKRLTASTALASADEMHNGQATICDAGCFVVVAKCHLSLYSMQSGRIHLVSRTIRQMMIQAPVFELL